MFHFWCRRLWILAGFCCVSTFATADTGNAFESILQDAVKGYLERKAEEAGLVPGKSENQDQQKVDKVTLQFSGADVPEPDVFVPLVAETPTNTGGNTNNSSAEEACYKAIQGKVAWNDKGTKNWGKSNVERLCKGTTKEYDPGDCFRYAMFNGHLWGKKSSHNMTWSKAIDLCAGTSNARQTGECFKSRIAKNDTLDKAISQCAKYKPAKTAVFIPTLINVPPVRTNAKNEETSCYNYVQGKIAWDNQGKQKSWNANNVKRLCKGTTSTYSPGNCFKYAMFKGSQWGKTSAHKMDWNKALDLCEGISNAQQVTGCFKDAIKNGNSLNQAIKSCEKKG